MQGIARAALTCYLFGAFTLHKTEYRRKLYFAVIKFSYLYLLYVKVYPYTCQQFVKIVFYGALLSRALI